MQYNQSVIVDTVLPDKKRAGKSHMRITTFVQENPSIIVEFLDAFLNRSVTFCTNLSSFSSEISLLTC